MPFATCVPIRRVIGLLCVCFCLASVVSVVASADDVPMQNLEIAKKDSDYQLLGEFAGPVDLGDAQYERLGVQVRAMGGGNFEALQYLGGLPGEKGFKNEIVSLLGRRSGDYLVLSGGPWALLVHDDHCVVVSQRGDRIGRLERLVRVSPTMGAPAPREATVLFDGSDLEHFTKAEMTEDGLLMEGADLKPMWQDFNLHVEFRLPFKPQGRGQDRGNSGLYLQSRYEVQVLDSFAETPTINGAGALYQYRVPDMNMCLPPLAWQTYDIMFTAPRWAADGTKTRNARITVWLNGVKVQDNQELKSKTGAGKQEEPTLLPMRIQNHGNPVRFRNFWVVDRGLYPGRFPVYPPAPSEEKEKPKAEPKPDEKKVEVKEEAAPDVKEEPKQKPKPKPEQKSDDAEKPAEKKEDPKPEQKQEEVKEQKPQKDDEKQKESKSEEKDSVENSDSSKSSDDSDSDEAKDEK